MSDSIDNSTITDLKVEIAMLKQEVSFINKLFEKMDLLIDKIDSQHDLIVNKTNTIETNLLFTKDELAELYNSLNHTEKQLSDRISSIENILSEKIKSINDDINTRLKIQETFTTSLKDIKLLGTGLLMFIAWLISNIESIKKLFN